MQNNRKAIGGWIGGAVRRIQASGLPKDVVEKAIAAMKGESEPRTAVRLSPALRKKLFELVRSKGPLVLAGKHQLKVFSLEGYINTVKQAKINGQKRIANRVTKERQTLSVAEELAQLSAAVK